MKVSLVWVLLFVGYCAAAQGVDINEVRRNAIKKLDGQVKDIQKLAEDTSIEVDKNTGNIKIITKHMREFGDGLIDKTIFEVKYYSKTFYMMAHLQGRPNTVFRCIESCERDSTAQCDQYYTKDFLDPGRDYESRAETRQRELLKAWKDNYYKSIDEYAAIYKRSVGDIQKSTSESSINSIVQSFDRITQQMSQIITEIFGHLTSLHIQVLRGTDQLVGSLENFGRHKVDETVKALQNCFPKAVQEKVSTELIF